ncbi:hypothetical protein BH11PSE4_BH11PSE4_35070 [soil metagenome]
MAWRGMTMTKSTERDHGLLSMIERIMRRPGDSETAKSAADEAAAQDLLDPVVDVEAAPAMLEPQRSVEGERTCSRAEMADIILRALRAIDGCPKQGLEVTVYGAGPWNAMLRITPGAGPLKDAAAWRNRVRDMVPRLREQFELLD